MTMYRSSAVVAPADLIPPGCERITGPRRKLIPMVRKARDRGELSVMAGPFALGLDQAEVIVRRHRAPVSPWPRRAVLIGVAVAVLGALGYAVVSILEATRAALRELAAPSLAGLLGIGLVLLIAAGLVRRGSGRVIEGTLRARIK